MRTWFLTATKPPRRLFPCVLNFALDVQPSLFPPRLTLSFPDPSLHVNRDMTSRISIARPAGASGGYQPDPHGFANSRPSSGYRAANPDDPLEKFKTVARQVEDNVEIWTQPLKPYLPAIGRFLIVVTFLEDSLRIVSQWSDQLWYLHRCVCFHDPPHAPFHTHACARADTDISHGVFHICFWPLTSL